MALNVHPATDKDGYLRNLEDWSPAVAEWLADNEGITLTEDHWALIELIRMFYAEHEVSPAMRALVKLVRERLGESRGNSLYLHRLLPENPAKLLAKIAGLPRPANCL